MHDVGPVSELLEPFQLETLGTGSILHLRGNINIVLAVDLKRKLLEAFEHPGQIEINCSEVTDMDLSAIQLLSGARLKALRAGRIFRASASPPEVVQERFALAGYDPFASQLGSGVVE